LENNTPKKHPPGITQAGIVESEDKEKVTKGWREGIFRTTYTRLKDL